ncbi:MAG: hypothetical protein V4726_17815 [Verrucomicrobiota bacterium]
MKPLLFLGLLAAVGSAGLAFMVRSSLKETRLHKDSQNRKALVIHNAVRETNNPAITTLNDQIAEAAKNAKNEDLSAKAERTAAKAKQEEVDAAKKETESLINQKQQIQEQINRIAGGVGTPEEIAAKMETLKKENDAKVQEIEQINKEMEIAKRASVENEQQLTRLRQAQVERTRTIGLSSRTSTVAAVNPDLGFVIVSSGKNQGVTNESRLLVKRGTQYIGKLRVAQVNANQTVADIASKSITPGFVIQPGDEVVFENNAH